MRLVQERLEKLLFYCQLFWSLSSNKLYIVIIWIIVGLASVKREIDQEMKKEERRLVTELRRESALIYCVMVYACPYYV